MSFALFILSALAMVLVIEGLLYAAFPDHVRRMMAFALGLPPEKLRMAGLALAGLGFVTLAITKALMGR